MNMTNLLIFTERSYVQDPEIRKIKIEDMHKFRTLRYLDEYIECVIII